MVDFTQPINNEDMVNGLNNVIRLSYDVIGSYEWAVEHLSDPGSLKAVRELKAMHEKHIGMIADTIRELGGAPVDSHDWRQWVAQGKTMLGALTKDKGVLAALHDNEERLRQECLRTISELNGSSNVVNVLNRVLDDGKGQRVWLEEAVTAG